MNALTPIDFDGAVNIEAEQALLGAILVNNEALAPVLEVGFEARFFEEAIHRDIFTAASSLITSGRKADPVTLRPFLPVDAEIGDTNLGGYLMRLCAEAVTVLHARDYALAVLDAYAARVAAQTLDRYIEEFVRRDPAKGITDIISRLEDDLGGIRALSPAMKARESMSGVMDAFLRRLNEGRTKGGRVIPFPLGEIADVLQEDGFQVGNLYGLLGSSGEGKTSLMLQCVRAAADAGNPVLLLSYDQTFEQVARQMISQQTGISVSQMLRHNPGKSETLNRKEIDLITEAGVDLQELPIQVRKLHNQKIGGILSIARNWTKTIRKGRQPNGEPWGSPLIILDHNRKVTPEDPKAHEGRIAGAVNGAGKAMAEELGAAVLFLNQRNGKGADRYVPRPIAADLFGGEQAREDYDAILYIYRPERWRDEQLSVAKDQKQADEIRRRFMLRSSWEDTPRDPEGMAEIGAIKVRYGAGGVRSELKFEGRYTRYASTRQTEPELF
ncbi:MULTISPECIES: replicative DNA helicase [unclassified Aureimonas]|uniref:replicative DNA helicase n=1 Tax=unclassified Aureimonas TaxID=2615206 RepID=UPI0006F3C953|nr:MULTISPECIES: DnaB-like helicase C-terminal domain-containing protein [unclassified Aureimonas]KQT52198.1 hypothetical protein ASG62_16195 [Aureimonas sp. Leaf427]KQT70570.1 hypothetical protein ASG54_21760 [Aureimonas sp. Leaf460]